MTAYNKMVNDGEWEGKVGEKPKRVTQHFGFDGLGTIDGEQTESAVAYIKKHAKDDKPFFMDINFMKFHQPNNPSKEFAGKSKQGIYYDALMEVDSYIGQIMDTLRDQGLSEEYHCGLHHGQWSLAGCSPGCGLHAVPRRQGHPVRGWFPGTCFHLGAGSS